MLRMLFLLLVCVVVDGLMMPTAESLEPRMHKGTVVSAGAGKISIKEEGGKEQSFAVEAMAKITVNGKPGRLEDFQESMPVQVTTDEKGRVLAVATMDGNKKGLASRT